MTQPDIELTGIGEHRPCPKRGILVFSSLPPAIDNAECSTAWWDYENRSWRASVYRDRAATPVERGLLEHLGFGPLPSDLFTRVEWLSAGVRRRTWPQIPETEGVTP